MERCLSQSFWAVIRRQSRLRLGKMSSTLCIYWMEMFTTMFTRRMVMVSASSRSFQFPKVSTTQWINNLDFTLIASASLSSWLKVPRWWQIPNVPLPTFPLLSCYNPAATPTSDEDSWSHAMPWWLSMPCYLWPWAVHCWLSGASTISVHCSGLVSQVNLFLLVPLLPFNSNACLTGVQLLQMTLTLQLDVVHSFLQRHCLSGTVSKCSGTSSVLLATL